MSGPRLPPVSMGEPFSSPFSAPVKRRRVSVFTEIGIGLDGKDDLIEAEAADAARCSDETTSSKINTTKSFKSENEATEEDGEPEKKAMSWSTWTKTLLPSSRWTKSTANSSTPPAAIPSLSHIVLLGMLLALVIPGLQQSVSIGRARFAHNGVDGGVIQSRNAVMPVVSIEERDDSPTSVCTRWSHQSAIINGTLYIYGGQAKKQAQQSSDTWNNDLISLDLKSNFQIGTPTFKGLPRDSSVPAVANGFLWNSYDSLFLYGGLFSDKPVTSPVPFSTWEYNVKSSSWKEHKNPQTSAGFNAEPDNVPVQRAAEGAGLSVPELGRGWYFGGHLDGYTTPGWSQSIARVYLKSMLEFTFPGGKNEAVKSLAGGKTAGSDGAYRNITEGGIQEAAGFTERADGNLVYVPGFGPEGIILGLAGGTNETFTEMNIIDVYDVSTSKWYKQATSGETPKIRVNACAVVAVSPDGSSFNVHMYGGQNLIPYGSQEQYDDIWILTIPSFTWIKVDTKGQSVPPARAGHSCNVWDGQMVVVGGYVGKDIGCDSPGVYVFDMSKLKWQVQFNALSGGNDKNQQPSQEKGSTKNGYPGLAALDGSYGYTVPAAVQSVIGGNGKGGATVTAPVQSATSGPIATGKVPTYTVTSDGTVVTQTGAPGQSGSQKSGPNVGAIVAGVIAGVFAILAAYLGFCAWVYRRQLALYKEHVAMSQRQATGDASMPEKAGILGLFPRSSRGSDSDRQKWATDQSSSGPSGATSSGYTPVASQGVSGSIANSSTDDLMAGQEPSFLGVMLNPRRSLRVINRD